MEKMEYAVRAETKEGDLVTLKRAASPRCQTLKTIPFACIFGAASG